MSKIGTYSHQIGSVTISHDQVLGTIIDSPSLKIRIVNSGYLSSKVLLRRKKEVTQGQYNNNSLRYTLKENDGTTFYIKYSHNSINNTYLPTYETFIPHIASIHIHNKQQNQDWVDCDHYLYTAAKNIGFITYNISRERLWVRQLVTWFPLSNLTSHSIDYEAPIDIDEVRKKMRLHSIGADYFIPLWLE